VLWLVECKGSIFYWDGEFGDVDVFVEVLWMLIDGRLLIV